MMLPTLISVSLAPGSYFFCADAAVAAMAAAVSTARATKFLTRAGIVFSPLAIYFHQVSQVRRTHASMRLFRRTKQHCCLPPIMIDAGRYARFHLQGPTD